ncbi:MAG TPA: ribosomal subunit interface protein, partial [Nitrospirae bacterium]|nr:ribosomal subunit interface protein [Nitrospirota bacterium]
RNFFIFTNDKTTEINVIFRRNDGDLGLVEPAR